MRMSRRAGPVLAVLGLALTAAAGCTPRRDGVADRSPAAGSADVAGYLAPPQALAATPLRDAMVRVTGNAPPASIVELDTPEGERRTFAADRRGGWSVRLPGGRLRLYALSARLGARVVRAEGALVTAPGALAPAVVLRAGAPARPLLGRGAKGMATVDYDPTGAIAVAGGAAPGSALTLLVDGAPAATGPTDRDGLYALVAPNRRLTLGPHRLEVRDAAGVQAARIALLSPPLPLQAPYQAEPAEGGGWRVEWALTGGGEQVTLILPP